MLKPRKGGRRGPGWRRRQGRQAGVHESGQDPKQSAGRGGWAGWQGPAGSKWCRGACGGACSHQAMGRRPTPLASPPTPRQAVLRCLIGVSQEGAPSLLQNWLVSHLCHREQSPLHSQRVGSFPRTHRSHQGALYTSTGKESTCSAGDVGSIPGLGRSPGEGNGYPLQYSDLENSMDCTVHRVAKSQT